MSTAYISLIVCTVGRQDVLHRLFVSLCRQDFRDFEVILVDQNPPGTLDSLVAQYGGKLPISHIRSARGLSRARNVGLAQACGTIVAFPDDDCWYEPDTLKNVVELFKQELDIATGRTLDEKGVPSVSPFLSGPARITRSNYLLCGNSNSIFAKRAAFERIGGFDERLGVGAPTIYQSGEEADILLRAIAAGLNLHFFSDLITHHDQVDAIITGAQIDRASRYGAGFGALLRKNDFSLTYVIVRLLRTLARAAAEFIRRDIPLAKYKIAWFRGTLSGYWHWGSEKAVSGAPSYKISRS
jgi:glycosyltransferase involved in cell wall biosynthesis